MPFDHALSHVIIGVAILIMGAVISRANKLMEVLSGSKAEPLWKKIRLSFYALTTLYFVIMITSLIFTYDDNFSFHSLIMNITFLITSVILLNLVNLDIKAFESLFALLDEES